MANRTPPRAAGRITALLLCVVTAATLAGVPAAGATDEPVLQRRVHRRGDCEERSTWRLSIRPGDPGMWRVRLKITTGRPGERWNIFMDRNGDLLFSRSRASDTVGDVVTRVAAENQRGRERFRFGALNVPTGETCQGSIRI